MTKHLVRLKTATSEQAVGFIAGVLIGISIWTPVFAAGGDLPQDWMTYAIVGAIALLVVGIALKAMISKRAQPYRLPRGMHPQPGAASRDVATTGGTWRELEMAERN